MNWISNVFRRRVAAAAAADDREALDARLRAAYESVAAGKVAEAEERFRALLEDDPRNADALYFLAVIAIPSGRALEAVDLSQKAVEIRPNDPACWFYLALAYHVLGLRPESVEAWRSAVAVDPGDMIARTNFGAALVDQQQFDEGREELEKVLASGHETPEARFNLGVTYRDHAQIEESIAACRRAIEMRPEYKDAYTNLLLTLNYSDKCDAVQLFSEHRLFGARFAKPYSEPPLDTAWPRRLRVGYVSPDFRNHVVMSFFEPILTHHDRARVEVFCYYCNNVEDHVTERLRSVSEHWVDCEHVSDDDLVRRIRADRIDILVDLAGHTGDNRLLVFAQKPAPVQATYLGYPGTTGIAAIDFRISDAQADPPGVAERFSAEQLLRPWPTYFSYQVPAGAPEPGPLPALENGYITFGCFNNTPKMSNTFLDTAARVLAGVPGSRLKLKSRTLAIAHVAERMGKRLRLAGIDPGRVDLLGWMPYVDGHLAAYRTIDIALDSLPYNGATTTCEAMWMGVPVVTFRGDRHAGRMGASLLGAVGLGHLVADDAEGYVKTAIDLASDVAGLASLRSGMRQRIEGSPLRDAAGFTRSLEQAYIDIWQEKIKPRERHAITDAELAALVQHMREERAAGNKIEAEEACKEVLKLRPDHREALAELWDLSYETRNHGVAVEWLRRGIAADDGVPMLHYMMGYSLMGQGNMPDAAESFRKCLALDPAMAKAHNNLGCAIEAMGDVPAALKSYKAAVELAPQLSDAAYNLGNAYRQFGQFDKAIEQIRAALKLEPQRADWKCNLGDLLALKLELDEAEQLYEQALAIAPDDSRALGARAWVLQQLWRLEEADAHYRRAMATALQPDLARIHSNWLLSLHYRRGDENLLEEHLAWGRRHTLGIGRQAARAADERRPARRLNIGYVSPDFKRHSVAGFIEPLLAAHDKARFKVFCYSSVFASDTVTERLRGLSEEWRDISRLRDEWIADRMRADRIDILVDLAGHTGEGRLPAFARKLAPVQVTWLGYPNTTGMGAIDYRLTDSIADPPGAEGAHAETLVRLDNGFLCYLPAPESSPVGDAPLLRNGHVTFGCFNNLPKLTPSMIALWAELLTALPQSRLMLKSFGFAAQSARQRVAAQFAARGIDPARIELAGPADGFADHLARYAEVDIALDVFPYNGTATTCEALWMGVPVVTLAGRAHASRVGASIMTSAGLAELIARSPEEYSRKALELARDGSRLRSMRSGMRERLRASPLLDAQGFARSVEKAYLKMWEDWVAKEEAADAARPLSKPAAGAHP